MASLESPFATLMVRFGVCGGGLDFDPMIDAALHFGRVGFLKIADVPVDLAFDHVVNFSAADVNRVFLDHIENRRRLPERARRFTKDSLHPPVFRSGRLRCRLHYEESLTCQSIAAAWVGLVRGGEGMWRVRLPTTLQVLCCHRDNGGSGASKCFGKCSDFGEAPGRSGNE